MSTFIDTHCHLDQYPDVIATLAEARRASVAVVAITDNPDAYRRLRTRLGKRSPDVSVALGLHPASAAAAAPGQLGRFFRMVPEAAWIGEVGLDYALGTTVKEKRRQLSVFESILSHELIQSKILSVHSRGAAAETVRLLTATPCRAILHWFTGSQKVADAAAAHGLWFSVNPAMVRSQRGAQLIGQLPQERILCETDGPYCQTEGRPASPADVPNIAKALAKIWRIDQEDATSRLARNAARLALGI